jgi:ATP-dependent DNA helicase RecQ
MTPHDVLEKYFGFREFLDAQEEVITAIAGGADALVVMPTGGGKSLCYQLPALLLEGTTIVVSPAIGIAVGLLMAIFWPEPDVDGVQS